MKSILVRLITLTAIAALMLAAATLAPASPGDGYPTRLDTNEPAHTHQSARPRSSPLLFIENVGQFASEARFMVRGGEQSAWLSEDAVWIRLSNRRPLEAQEEFRAVDDLGVLLPPRSSPAAGVNLKLSFVGASAHTRLEPFDRVSTRVSYLLGSDPAAWHSDVPAWRGVRYKDIYPGVDLEITGGDSPWNWRLVVRTLPLASDVRLRVEGAQALSLAGDRLCLDTAAGDFNLPLLGVDSADVDLPGVRPAVLDLEPGTFDVTTPFVAAPSSAASSPDLSLQDNPGTLLYSTFLGGGDDDYSLLGPAAVDQAGHAYVTGYTCSEDFPTTPGAFDESYNSTTSHYCEDVFVARLNPDGSNLVYATFLGGTEDDFGRAIEVDQAGAAYVTGYTASPDFPSTPGAFDEHFHGGYYPFDAFVAKISPDGTQLLYATFLAGGSNDIAQALVVDEAGDVYVAGTTMSSNFPTTPGAYDTSYNPPDPNGESDAFVAKLRPAGSGRGDLLYSTYLGAGADEGVTAMAVDGAGHAYVTGNTQSPGFPTTPGAFDTTPVKGKAFVTRFNPTGSELVYSTFLGAGSNGDGIWVDAMGQAYVTGYTASPDFPVTPGAYDTSLGGSNDAFVLKLDANGANLVFSTLLGGDKAEYGNDIALDKAGNIYLTGSTRSANFPVTPGAYDTSFNGGFLSGGSVWSDVFVARLDPTGAELTYATFLGGDHTEAGYGIVVIEPDSVYVSGRTQSADFPTTPGAFDTEFGGGLCLGSPCNDVFVTKLVPRYILSGRVLDSSESPLVGLQLSASTSGTVSYTAVTDAGGYYTLTDMLAGTYGLAPSPGYFWSPISRSVSLPPDIAGQDFVGRTIYKQVDGSSSVGIDFGQPLTYTIHVLAPTSCTLALYDRVPTYTSYISGTLDAPAGIAYEQPTNAISGTLNLDAAIPVTVSFAVRVGVTGTLIFAPLLTNRACLRPPGSGLAECTWSNEVRRYTYVRSIYMPLVVRNQGAR